MPKKKPANDAPPVTEGDWGEKLADAAVPALNAAGVPAAKGALAPGEESIPPEGRREIGAASAAVTGYAAAVLDAQSEVKQAKKVLEGCEADHAHAVARLQEVIQKWTGPVGPNLFDQRPEPDDAWRGCDLGELVLLGGLTEAQVEKLEGWEPPIRTMGELCDFLAGPPQRHYTDLPGFGAAKAEKLEEAMAKFWERHPRAGEAAAADSATVEPYDADEGGSGSCFNDRED
jgi:hypothetical protein